MGALAFPSMITGARYIRIKVTARAMTMRSPVLIYVFVSALFHAALGWTLPTTTTQSSSFSTGLRTASMPRHRPFLTSRALSSEFAMKATSEPLSAPNTTSFDYNFRRGNNNENSTTTFQPVFDFTESSTIDKVERLDDAIMGGISTSSVRAGDGYARWSGVCRTDGGGFCGFRTNPFTTPLFPGRADGFYAVIRLASDVDAERRVWKFSTRVKPDRGELLYQAPVTFDQSQSPEHWSVVKIPFDSFRLVRGPRFVSDGPPLDTTGGLYQVGMTMSQFEFGGDLKAIPNFRDGYFELQIKEIGLFQDEMEASLSHIASPQVLAKEEARKKRPLMLKVLRPVTKIFFSEPSQRRKQAMKLLTKERKLTRPGAILFGLKSRASNVGWFRSIARFLYILIADSVRTSLQLTLKIGLLYPIRLVQNLLKVVRKVFKRTSTTKNAT